MKKRIKISDYPNIKKQIGRISIIISMYLIGSTVLGFIGRAISCLREIKKWKEIGSESGYDIDLSKEFLIFFAVGVVIGTILFIYLACRYNNIRTTKLGKSVWKYMEVKEDSYYERELKRLDYELEQSCSHKIKEGHIILTEKWLLGIGNLFRIDVVPIKQIRSIEAKLQHKITGNASGKIRTYRSPVLLITLKSGEIKGFFISNMDYGNEIVRKVHKRINNENFSDKYE